ncbi:MAG: HAD family hydrolase [Candidatus Kapabacteria bacterium]|nr:HAD family hydrolase [Candidatus Kapabacteria bacterium]
MNLQAITIDFWNTIYDSTGGFDRNAYRQRCLIEEIDKHGLFIMGDEINKSIEATWAFFEKAWKEEHRTPSTVESITFLFNYLKLPLEDFSVNKVANAFADSVLVHPPQLLPDAKDSIQKLSSKYKLGLISDTGFSPGTILKELMIRDGIANHFTSFSFSDETGVSKPHSLAYLTALNQLKIDPINALHIGDIEHTDILGAKNFGMKAIRIKADKTSHFAANSPENTIADFDLSSWKEILDLLM